MKSISRLAAHGLLVVACIAFARPASAAVTVYDNLANQNNGFFGIGPNNWLAERFKSDPTNLLITDVTVRFAAQTPGPYSLGLYSEVSGKPGVPLANLFTGNTSGGAGGANIHYSTSALTAPSTNYWIVASVANGVTINSGWGVTSNTGTGTGTGFFPLTASSGNQGGSWATNPDVAYQMQVIATVPEPGTAALVGIAALSTLARRRRPEQKRRRPQIS